MLINLIIMACAMIFTGCAGMTYKKCSGDKCAYYKDGKQLSDEEAAKENPAIAEEVAKKKMAQKRQVELRNAPRRSAEEEIRIAVLPAESIMNGQVSIDPRMAAEWRKLFQNSAPIKLIDEQYYGKYLKVLQDEYANKKYHTSWYNHAAKNRVPGEVYVYLRLGTKDIMGINKKTKKLASGKQLLLTAEVSSTYAPKITQFQEPIPNILQNQKAFNNLAAKVKEYINSTLRAELPSFEWLNARRDQDKQMKMNAIRDAAKSWFGGDKAEQPAD